MDPSTIEMGPRYGYHGTYTFYKAFRYWVRGRWRTISMEKFFFVNSSSLSKNSSLCIGEIQLIWTVKSEPQEPLSSLRLYFMPEQSPGGRQSYHGQDEVLAAENKIIIRVKDLISWLVVENVPWTSGSVLPAHLCDVHQGMQPVECPVVIISYPKYCRLIAMKKRLESAAPPTIISNGSTLSAMFAAALRTSCSVYTDLTPQTRIMFCRSTFGHPDVDDHKLRFDHLAPNLKGRPRSKHRGALKTLPDTEYVPLNAVPPKPKRGRPRKGVISEAMLRAEGPFLKAVYSFMKDRGTPIHRIPSLGFKKIDLFVFYKTAEKLGGYKQICSKRMWKVLHDKIGGNPGSTSAATCTRKHYERLLLPFEEHLRSTGSSRSSSMAATSASSKAAARIPQSSPKPKAVPIQPSSSTCLDVAAWQQRPGSPATFLAEKGGSSIVAAAGSAAPRSSDATGGSGGAEHQHQPTKRRHAPPNIVLPSDGSGGGIAAITVPGGWLLARHAAAISRPPPPSALPLPGGGPEPSSLLYDPHGRQPGEQLLESVLRNASLPAGGLLPGTMAAASGQQQQHLQLLHHLYHNAHQQYGGGSTAIAASINRQHTTMPASDGRALLATVSGQPLPVTHEQLHAAASSSGPISAGRQSVELQPNAHRREVAADAHAGRAVTAVQLLQQQRRLQQQLTLAAATIGSHTGRNSLPPPPYFSTATGERRALPPPTSQASSTKRSRREAEAPGACTAVAMTTAMALGRQLALPGAGHQLCGTGNDMPLDLTCKPGSKTVTSLPTQLAGSKARKQQLSPGGEQPGAAAAVTTAGRGDQNASTIPVYLTDVSGVSEQPHKVPINLTERASTAAAATVYESYVTSSPELSSRRPSHQPLDSYCLGLGDYASSLQQPVTSSRASGGSRSSVGAQLAGAAVQASAQLAAIRSESAKATVKVSAGSVTVSSPSSQLPNPSVLQVTGSADAGKRHAPPTTVQHYALPAYPCTK